jgi:hypothetical protein
LSTNRKLTILILTTSFVLLSADLTSELSLGDVVHYHFARDIFNASRRVAFAPLYGNGNPPGYLYNSAPLWHILLALLWRLFGKTSFSVCAILSYSLLCAVGAIYILIRKGACLLF